VRVLIQEQVHYTLFPLSLNKEVNGTKTL